MNLIAQEDTEALRPLCAQSMAQRLPLHPKRSSQQHKPGPDGFQSEGPRRPRGSVEASFLLKGAKQLANTV